MLNVEEADSSNKKQTFGSSETVRDKGQRSEDVREDPETDVHLYDQQRTLFHSKTGENLFLWNKKKSYQYYQKTKYIALFWLWTLGHRPTILDLGQGPERKM